MQSSGRLLSAVRRGLPAASRVAPTFLSTAGNCVRCGRSVGPALNLLAPARFFARKSDNPTPTQNSKRASKSTAKGSSSTDEALAVVQANKDLGESSRDALMRLVAQLPAAEVPAAIAVLTQRLADHAPVRSARQPRMQVTQAEVEVEEAVDEAQRTEEVDEEETDEWDENDAECAQLRDRLAREGMVRTEAGEEIMSMEEVERQLKEGGGAEDEDEEEFVLAEEEDGEEAEDGEEEEEEEHEQALQVTDNRDDSVQPSKPSSSASSSANTFWIQEHRDGTVTVTEWPALDDDSDLADSYDLNMPHNPAADDESAVVGQAIGGEKLTRTAMLAMREKDLSEHFTKGGGRGGQKVNKTSNCVHLHHIPTGTIVKCHATRSLADNRRIAREIMQGRLEELVLGPASKNAQRRAKLRKRKAKTRKRVAAKYGEQAEQEEEVDDVGSVVRQHSSGGGGDNK